MINLVALKSELTTDPTGMGYNTAGDTNAVLAQLNLPVHNVGGESIDRPTDEIGIFEIAAIIDNVEYAALDEYNKDWVRAFISRGPSEQLKPYQSKFLQVFDSESTTRTAALELRAKLASRAEILFGVNTQITRQNLIDARNI